VEELFYFAAAGAGANGTLAGDAGEALLDGEAADVLFCEVDEGADEADSVGMHVEGGEVGGELAFVEEVEEEGLGAVVAVVAKGDSGGAVGFGGVKDELAPLARTGVAL